MCPGASAAHGSRSGREAGGGRQGNVLFQAGHLGGQQLAQEPGGFLLLGSVSL